MFKKSLFIIFTILCCWSCGERSGDQATARDLAGRQIKIVATTGMVGDAVKNVGGERVQVTTLMGPGIDPHLYKASEGDVTRMASADMIFYNGLHLEGKMAEVFEKMRSRIKTVAIAEGIDSTKLLTPPSFTYAYDPHIWFDVSLWIEAVNRVARSLEAFDAAHAAVYQANAKKYIDEELAALHQYAKDEIGKIDPHKRVLVTAHDAFNYFGKAYGMEVRGLQGISTASETGTADVQALAEFIVERQIPAVFVETSVPPRYIEALQAAVKSRGFDVAIGGHLYSDAMGDPGTAEGTYLGMVRHNVNTIVSALTRQNGVAMHSQSAR